MMRKCIINCNKLFLLCIKVSVDSDIITFIVMPKYSHVSGREIVARQGIEPCARAASRRSVSTIHHAFWLGT